MNAQLTPAPPAPLFAMHAPTIADNGYDVVPVHYGKKNPIGNGWQNYKFKPDDVGGYAVAGVGILTGRTPAIDIDVRDAGIVVELDAVAKLMLRWPAEAVAVKLSPIRVGLAPKMLRPCQLDGQLFKKKQTREFVLPGDKPGDKKHKVEILADGQQFVAFNIHPDTRAPYQWDSYDPTNVPHEYLPLLSEADADEFIKRCDAILAKYGSTESNAVPAPPLSVVTPAASDFARNVRITDARNTWNNDRDRLIAALKTLDPDMSRAKWVSVGAALHLASGGSEEGFTLFNEFSSGELAGRESEQYAADGGGADGCRGRWDSYKHTGKTLANLGSIFKAAKEAGWVPPPTNEEQAAQQAYQADIAKREAGIEEGISPLDFFAVATLGLVFIPTREVWDEKAVDNRLPNWGGLKPSKWLAENRSAATVVWSPGDPMLIKDQLGAGKDKALRKGVDTFNLYRPPTVKPGYGGGAGFWVDLVRKLYPDDADHIIKWCAHRRQRPNVKPNHGIVLGGAFGIGKDSMLEPLVAAVGRHNFKEVSPGALIGRFNPFVKAVVLRVNEAHDTNELTQKDIFNKTKIYLAAPPDVIPCDEKNLREHDVMNLMGVIFTTNSKTGLYLPPNDRRHYVAWSSLTSADFAPGYWLDYYSRLSNGGIEDVVAYLDSIDLSTWNAFAEPPKTEAFWTMANAGRAPEESIMNDVLDAVGRPAAVTLDQLYDAALPMEATFAVGLKDVRQRRQVPHRLDEAGYVSVRSRYAKDGMWKIAGKRQAVYARKELSVAEQHTAVAALLAKLKAGPQ